MLFFFFSYREEYKETILGFNKLSAAHAHVLHAARGERGVLPSCSLCTNELSINENGKHLFCEHKGFSWINYCTTATK